MLTDDQLGQQVGSRLRRELADIEPSRDLLGSLRRRQAKRRAGTAVAACATAAAGTLAAGTLAVTALLPGTAPPTPATLTAWSVHRQPDGDVKVTIRDLRDPQGLQRRLREDGIPAGVYFGRGPSKACSLTAPPAQHVHFLGKSSKGTVITLRPSDIPSGAGVAIYFSNASNQIGWFQHKVTIAYVEYSYVRASKQCIGP
jgi:hypothetical protein